MVFPWFSYGFPIVEGVYQPTYYWVLRIVPVAGCARAVAPALTKAPSACGRPGEGRQAWAGPVGRENQKKMDINIYIYICVYI